MNQVLAVWIVIGLALVMSNLPFLAQRPFLVLPWTQTGEPARPFLLQLMLSVVFFALLIGVGYYAFILIGQAFFVPSDAASTGLFLLKVLGSGLAVAVLLGFSGWRNRGHTVQKSFFVRLIELLIFYFLTGVLGFALEFNMGNMFAQKWEFYAISLSLFVVLGFPGFVYRYLMRHPKPRKVKPKQPLVA